VLDPSELKDDPQLRARAVLVEQDTPWGKSTQVRLPVGAPAEAPPPAMGEHGRAILRESGLSDAEVDALVSAGATR
jgi:crotonobetainyl-CoA:carnitine CoA-transferase CaiB-like acyl-CoA transferase